MGTALSLTTAHIFPVLLEFDQASSATLAPIQRSVRRGNSLSPGAHLRRVARQIQRDALRCLGRKGEQKPNKQTICFESWRGT